MTLQKPQRRPSRAFWSNGVPKWLIKTTPSSFHLPSGLNAHHHELASARGNNSWARRFCVTPGCHQHCAVHVCCTGMGLSVAGQNAPQCDVCNHLNTSREWDVLSQNLDAPSICCKDPTFMSRKNALYRAPSSSRMLDFGRNWPFVFPGLTRIPVSANYAPCNDA